MKIAIVVFACLSAICAVFAGLANASGRSQDEKLGALMPLMGALLFFAIDFNLIIGYGLYRLFAE